MNRFWFFGAGLALAIGMVFASGAPVMACDFSFNYTAIEAPVGTEGKIGVQVAKTHARCSMSDELDYQFDWRNIQILGQTAWDQVEQDVYEKWFWVSLSVEGEGYLRISRECTKEGYDETVLPITVLPVGSDDSVWDAAMKGNYPFEGVRADSIDAVSGHLQVGAGGVRLDEQSLSLPLVPVELADYSGEVRVYFKMEGETRTALLIVGKGLFLRFDQYVV